MKILDGKELAGFITERQARQVRGLRQARKIFPKLAIISTTDSPVIATYVRLKRQYGEDILIGVDVYNVAQDKVPALVEGLNQDKSIHGIVLQLPLSEPSETDELVNLILPEKDVDGLGDGAKYGSATAIAINWLLAGYNVDLKGKKLAIVGLGRLVGAPLLKMWQIAGHDVHGYDESTPDLEGACRDAGVIVSATGVPGLIKSSMVAPGATVVDAGTASEGGRIVGDVAEDVRARSDLTITPKKGGVGPLTVAALFDNVIQAAGASESSEA